MRPRDRNYCQFYHNPPRKLSCPTERKHFLFFFSFPWFRRNSINTRKKLDILFFFFQNAPPLIYLLSTTFFFLPFSFSYIVNVYPHPNPPRKLLLLRFLSSHFSFFLPVYLLQNQFLKGKKNSYLCVRVKIINDCRLFAN